MNFAEKGAGSKDILRLEDFIRRDPRVKFAYLFGSQARNNAGVLSDIDIAVYLDGRLDAFKFRLVFTEESARVLGRNDIDLITLNDAPLPLQYEIIREGKVLKEDKKRRVNFETRILSSYLDTAHLRRVQQQYLKKRFSKEKSSGQ
jgi:predicted nucleotidyltransferase